MTANVYTHTSADSEREAALTIERAISARLGYEIAGNKEINWKKLAIRPVGNQNNPMCLENSEEPSANPN